MGWVQVAEEMVPCVCGHGTLVVTVSVENLGHLAFSQEAVARCGWCFSTDLTAARTKRVVPLP